MDSRARTRGTTGDSDAVTACLVNATARQARAPAGMGCERPRYPCSPSQRHYWLLHQFNPDNPALHISVRWHLDDAIPHVELEAAFRTVILRHQVLRTFFTENDNEIAQFVEPHVPFHIPVLDLTQLTDAEKQTGIERAARQQASAAFELMAPPLLRVTQVRMGNDSSLLLVTVHRIVSDHSSLDMLASEIGEICAALHAKRPPVLPTLPVSYGKVATWLVEQQVLAQEADTEYWKRALQGKRHFELRADRLRPPLPTANASILSVALGKTLIDDLADLANRNWCTLFEAGLAAFLTLLHRYTNETDIAIGGQFAGRDETGFENLVGPFGYSLVLRNDLSGDPDFLTLLARIRDRVAESLAHRNIAPERYIEIAGPGFDPNRDPLFPVNFMFQRLFARNSASTVFRPLEQPACSAKLACDLNFTMVKGPDGWQASCAYNADLFDGQTIVRLLRHYKNLLGTVVVDPTQKISNLILMDDDERSMLIVESNRTGAIYPKYATLPQLFQAQAGRTPDAVAVVCGERSMSYRELDMASNRLAHVLRKQGVEPASRVAVVLNRSLDLMVALLAILKSGCTYIPLDPGYPAERLRHVFENSRPAAVITRDSFSEQLLHNNAPVILVDTKDLLNVEHDAAPLAPSATSDDPAYIIYTSGSTGKPKGVTICHRALVNLLYSMRRQPGLTPDDTVVSVTTVSFDMVVPDLFLPLIVGAKLILAKEQEMVDGTALYTLLRRHHATFMQATPVTWQLLLEAGWRGDPSLKMLCGGEAMPRKLAESLLQCGGELWNMYGPTETTVWSSALRVESGDGPVDLGPPIDNTQFYILDDHQKLVPHGVPGELYIGGDGVALGYFDLPEVTREKFVPDKFRKRHGAMLYRTGDLVRMKQHGRMEYLGRADHQIKMRGFRIEPGEIEAVLLRQSNITDAVAVLGTDPAGGGAIWAYAVAARCQPDSDEVLIDALRTSLKQSLPGYMCPSSIVLLDALPRTPNGKIDRRALPAPAPSRSKHVAQPLNEIERQLAAIWSSILGREGISKTDDFFDLGGHSLLAARLLARIETGFGKRLSLSTLFTATNIESQAKLLMHNDQREYDFRQVVRLEPAGTKPPLIAIHNTGVYFYNLSRCLGPDQPLIALQLFDPSIARQSLPQTLEDIAGEYVRLIHKCQPTGPYKLIGWCVGGVLAFEVARQLVAAGHVVSLLAMIDAWAPGHNKRLSWLRAILADYSYRWQLIGADWRRVMMHEQSVTAFLAQRTVSKRLARWFGHTHDDKRTLVASEPRESNAEEYDQWLLDYLEEMVLRYVPKFYSGKIRLLCSAREPKGLFLDPQQGWGPFSMGGVDVDVIDGDHFTVFKGQGLEQMAMHIASAMAVQNKRSNLARA